MKRFTATANWERIANRERIEEINTEISRMERSINVLRREKELLQEHLDAYKYPLLTLPNEITSEIFIQFLPVYPLCPPTTGILSPTLFTHICRQWRDIALATPSLWRAISLFDAEVEPQVLLMQSWLTRSACCSLSIQFPLDPSFRFESSVHFLDTLTPHRARLEYVHVHLLDADLPLFIDDDMHMPLLRRLTLDLDPGSSSISRPLALGKVPLLRTVALNNWATSKVLLPWDQLTSLTLEAVTPYECGPILRQTINLVHCQLVLCLGFGSTHGPDITLPRLESLVLSRADTQHPPTEYPRALILPSLRRLRLPEAVLGWSDPIGTLLAFISRSSCQLEQLWMVGDREIPKATYRTAFPAIHNIVFNASFTPEWLVTEEPAWPDEDSDED